MKIFRLKVSVFFKVKIVKVIMDFLFCKYFYIIFFDIYLIKVV